MARKMTRASQANSTVLAMQRSGIGIKMLREARTASVAMSVDPCRSIPGIEALHSRSGIERKAVEPSMMGFLDGIDGMEEGRD